MKIPNFCLFLSLPVIIAYLSSGSCIPVVMMDKPARDIDLRKTKALNYVCLLSGVTKSVGLARGDARKWHVVEKELSLSTLRIDELYWSRNVTVKVATGADSHDQYQISIHSVQINDSDTYFCVGTGEGSVEMYSKAARLHVFGIIVFVVLLAR